MNSLLERIQLLPQLGENRPDFYAVQWEPVIECLAVIVILAFLVERFLAVFFETETYIAMQERLAKQGKGSRKALIAFATSLLVVWACGLDVLAILTQSPTISVIGVVLTGGVVAGGSKASIKLFRDVLGFKSGPYEEYQKRKTEAQKKSRAGRRKGGDEGSDEDSSGADKTGTSHRGN